MSANRPRTMTPRSGARSAWAPPRVAARSASATLIPKWAMARLMTTSGMRGDAVAAGRVVGAERDRHALVEQRRGPAAPADSAATCPGRARRPRRPWARAATSSSQASCSRSAEAQPSSAASVAAPVRDCAAGVQPGQQPGRAAGAEHPARLALGEPALVAVHVHAVGPGGGRVRAPAAHRVHVVVAAAEELRRHRVGGEEGHVHPRHARLVLQRPQQPHVGELAVAGQVVAGLGLDGRGAGQQPARAAGSRTPLHSVQGSVPRVTVTVEAMPPPAAAISVGEDPPERMASSAQRLPA